MTWRRSVCCTVRHFCDGSIFSLSAQYWMNLQMLGQLADGMLPSLYRPRLTIGRLAAQMSHSGKEGHWLTIMANTH